MCCRKIKYRRLQKNGSACMNHRRLGIAVISLLWVALSAARCAAPGGTLPVVKIGLIAPVEGIQRTNGYQRLYGVKLALKEANRSGGVAGYKVELVALNDSAILAESVSQARELALDPDVVGVIGNWQADLLSAGEPIFAEAGLAVVNPVAFDDFSGLPASFSADYQALGGTSPDEQAMQAYAATKTLLRAIETAAGDAGRLQRGDVLAAWRDIQ